LGAGVRSRERLGVGRVPAIDLGADHPGIIVGEQVERDDQVPRDAGIGLHRQRPAIAGNRLVELSLFLEARGQVVERLGMLRADAEGFVEFGDAFVEPAVLAEEAAEVVVRLGIIRADRDRPAVGCDGRLKLAGPLEGGAEVVIRFGGFGAELDRAAVNVGGFQRFALLEQDVSEVVVRVEETGLQRERGSERIGRFGQPPPRRQDGAEVAVVVGVVGIGLHRPTHELDRFIGAAGQVGDLPEHLERGGVGGVAGEDLPAEAVRLLRAPGLKLVDRELNGLIGGQSGPG